MIHEFLTSTAVEYPGRTAVIQKQNRVTYAELHSGMLRAASFFVEHGVQKGDRVCIVAENSPEYIMLYFGIQKAGGISVPVNSQCSAYELGKIITNCLPECLIVEKKTLKAAQEAVAGNKSLKNIIVIDADAGAFNGTGNASNIKFHSLHDILTDGCNNGNYPAISGNDIASIIYTSGTTGEPKGAMLSHNNFTANAKSIIQYLNLTHDDRIMVVLPFCYSYGTSLLTTHIIAGGSMVLDNSFMYPNVILDKMIVEGVTGFAGVPSTYAILLNRSNIRKYRFPKLRYITQAGGAMSPAHAREIAEILPDAAVYIMYGQTEATARLTYLAPKDFLSKPGSIGKAIPGVSIEVLKEDGTPAAEGEEGEIVACGENIMAGYWNNPEETKKVLRDGKLHTGDLAVKDSGGYLRIISRRSDMLKSGAHRISPKEIEEVILELPEVHEVAVIGIEDEILGMAIKAVIVTKDGAKLDPKKVQKHCHQKLAPYKIPREVAFVSELPKTASGKVRKYLLKERRAEI
ncbi:MAG: acyl--CoA ligase [Nitrospirae bacterium]|nr:acyl--CoA ligase [Nitrospirota bacterium]